ncbi:hypothetical protein [Mycoplasma todarodis]|uniref:hypothetical protein n=1 Tax=Mycoplasma todarodis TaxID=1937191 RepID=UPI003B30FB8F
MKLSSNKWALLGVGALTGAVVVGTATGVWYAVEGNKAETIVGDVHTQDTIDGLNKKIQDLEDFKTQLEQDAAADKAEIAKLTQDLADAINNNPNTAALQKQIDDLKAEKTQLEADVAAKDIQISDLTKDLADANKQVATIVGLQKQIADLTDENQQQDADIAKLTQDFLDLSKDLDAKIQEIAAKNQIIADKDATIDAIKKQYYILKDLNPTGDHGAWEDSLVTYFKANVAQKPTTDVKQWTAIVANKNGFFTMKKSNGTMKHHTEWDVAGDFTGGFVHQKVGGNDFFVGTKKGLYIEEAKTVKEIVTGDFTHSTMIEYKDGGVKKWAVYKNDGFYEVDVTNKKLGTTPVLTTDLKIQTSQVAYDATGKEFLYVGTDQGGYWITDDGAGGLKQEKFMDGDIQFMTEIPQWENGAQNGKFDLYIGTTAGLFQTGMPNPGDIPSVDKLVDGIDLTGGFMGFDNATATKEGEIYVGTPAEGIKKLHQDKLVVATVKPEHAFDETYAKGGFMLYAENLILVGTATGTYTLEDGETYGKLPGPVTWTTPAHHIY